MSADGVEATIRRAIGGDVDAATWIVEQAEVSRDARVVSLAALLQRRAAILDRAATVAGTSRDRQLVAIARAHLDGDRELVDALARDHLVDHPGSLIVAWLASDDVAGGPSPTAP